MNNILSIYKIYDITSQDKHKTRTRIKTLRIRNNNSIVNFTNPKKQTFLNSLKNRRSGPLHKRSYIDKTTINTIDYNNKLVFGFCLSVIWV